MCSRTVTKKYTRDCLDKIARISVALKRADAIVIGGGAGLSISAGFSYTGERFKKYFGDFSAQYGFTDMYTGGFYPYQTQEEYWGYWSRYIYWNRYTDPPYKVYEDLLELVRRKPYFVLTTNVDHCFQKAGFDKNRLFYTQGDYGLFQCSKPCHGKTYDNENVIKQMFERQTGRKVPTELIPKCPLCGAPMTVNLRVDDTFVQDSGWQAACGRYEAFIRQYGNGMVLFLELGVGGNTPMIIKYPFWQMTADNPKAVYVCVNDGEAVCPQSISPQAVCVKEDIGAVLSALKEKLSQDEPMEGQDFWDF